MRFLAFSVAVALVYVLTGVHRAAARDAVTQPLVFHSNSTLDCEQCHAMHYSENGASRLYPPPSPPEEGSRGVGPFPSLLFRNVTDLCLSCHKDSTAPNVWSGNWPGGSYSNTGTGGDSANGHNPGGTFGNESKDIPLDPTLGLTPPGQTQTLPEFHCATCHEPHGWSSDAVNGNPHVFAYRLLRKQIVGPGGAKVDVSGVILNGFAEEQLNEEASNMNHNVYRSLARVGDGSKGFGKWCAACHGGFHSDTQGSPELKKVSGQWIRHPTAMALGDNVATNYGATYNPDYPVETTNTSATTDANWSMSGTTERVFCLSCHYAHASPYKNATRWNNTVASGARTGCNKCHAKGE